MNKSFQIILFLLNFGFAFSKANSQEQAVQNPDLSFYDSTFLNDSVPYRVILPEDFQSKKDNLDLLILLDGDEYVGIAKNTISLYEYGEKINPTLIISLPSTVESRWAQYTPTKAKGENDDSNADMYALTGKFNDFADFISMELIPSVKEKYSIEFKRQTIFGHSMGGLAGLCFAVLRPEVFDNYILASPASMYDNHFILHKLEENEKTPYRSMFITAALKDANGYRENVDWLYEYLQKNRTESQKLEMIIYPYEIHSTTGIKSLIDGLEFIGGNEIN